MASTTFSSGTVVTSTWLNEVNDATFDSIYALVGGVPTGYATLAAAVTGIGSTRATVVVRGDVTMAASAAFPSTATLRIENRARITTTGFTLSFYDFECGDWQCFTGSGTVTVNDANVEINPAWFGAAGDWNGSSGTDDTAALMAACAAISGAGTLALGSKRYRLVVASGQTIGTFSSLRGLKIKSSGAELAIDRSFTVGQVYQLFQFTACNNVEVEPLKVSCTYAGTGAAKFDRGYEVFKLLQGCNGFIIHHLEVSSVRSGLMCRRETTDAASYSSRNIRGRIKATNVGYPANFILSGDQVELWIDSEGCTRSYYPYGVAGHRVKVRSKNSEGNADCYLSSAVGYGLSDINLEYQDYDSTGSDNSLRKVVLSFGDQTAAVFRNITVKVDMKLTNTNYTGTPFEIEKLNSGGSYDTVDRGHKIEGLDVDVNLVSGSTSQPSMRICSGGTWSTGEFLSNIRMRLRTDGAGQATINLASLADVAILENSYSASQINITGGTGILNIVNSSAPTWSYTGKVAFDGWLRGSTTLDPASLAAGATQTSTVTVTGAATGDYAIAQFGGVDAGIEWSAQVTSANTVTVRQRNNTGGSIDLGSSTIRVAVMPRIV